MVDALENEASDVPRQTIGTPVICRAVLAGRARHNGQS
jgi:hypothetical protein